ncbi:MAG: GDSL-type esterase/lipase family protein [Planctomycetota bacterium]|jgi:lysophospholipase L1-like esterase
MKNTTYTLRVVAVLVSLFTGLEFSAPLVGQETDRFLTLPETDDGLPGTGPIRRYDWFQNLWTERRTLWSSRVKADQNTVVFLGDSITQGWGDDMGNTFPGLRVANRGISGDTTRGMLLRLKNDVLALKPKGIVMLMGTNDLEEGADAATISKNIELMLEAIRKNDPKTPVTLCRVFPASASKKRPSDQIQAINAAIANVAKGFPQVTMVDTWTLFANEKGDAKESEFPDLLHPNQMGYAKWGAAIRPVLATQGLVETELDPFTVEPGFIALTNGKDLSGWRLAATKSQPGEDNLEGKVATSDGRYVAINGRIVVTTPPEGRRIQQLYTKQEFPGDFILKLEFRATPNADSGVFIREPQLQCRDYPLAGPYKHLKNYRPQDWNELIVTVKDNVAVCTCNGEIIEEALKLPSTGPIGLEGDHGQMEYRRIRIQMTPIP